MSRYKKKVSPSDPEVNQRVSTGMACKPAPPLPPCHNLPWYKMSPSEIIMTSSNSWKVSGGG